MVGQCHQFVRDADLHIDGHSLSPRTHTLLVIQIAQTTMATLTDGSQNKEVVVSTITVVDLAGCERPSKTGATAFAMKAAQSVNRSLTALGDVILAVYEAEG